MLFTQASMSKVVDQCPHYRLNDVHQVFYASGRLRATNLPVQDQPSALLTADIDDDDRMEIVVVNEGSNDIWVIHQRATPVAMPIDCAGFTEHQRSPRTPSAPSQ